MYNYKVHWTHSYSTITRCISIFAFTSLLGISIGIMGSTIELKFFAVAAGIKKCKSIIKKQRKKHDKIVLLAKSKFNSIVLIFKALIDWNISHDELF